MIDNNHLSSVPCYNGTMLTNEYYNEFFDLGQQKINFNFYELCLPDDDPVYTLKKVMEDLDFSGLLACYVFYELKGKKLTGDVLDELNYQFLRRLKNEGLITLKELYIDGTNRGQCKPLYLCLARNS